MKRILASVLVVVLIFSLAACGNEDGSSSKKTTAKGPTEVTTSPQSPDPTQKKIEGTIIGASVFSEGLAFVSANGNKEKTYCINKEGYIVFELDFRLVDPMGEIDSKFVNGLAQVGEGICDTKGNIVMPEDVGVTSFCVSALEDGYILAERITSTFDSSTKELGVMNTKFEWIVEPTEELYEATGGNPLIPNEIYYSGDGIFFFEETEKYVDLKTGEFFDSLDSYPSKQWFYGFNGFYDMSGNIVLDLSEYSTYASCYGSKFVDGKAPIRFINTDTNKYYFTLINEAGEFLFDPVEAEPFRAFIFDGENLLLLNSEVNPTKIYSYDIQGNLLGSKVDTEMETKCFVSDDIIVVISGTAIFDDRMKAYYFNLDFTPLF